MSVIPDLTDMKVLNVLNGVVNANVTFVIELLPVTGMYEDTFSLLL